MSEGLLSQHQIVGTRIPHPSLRQGDEGNVDGVSAPHLPRHPSFPGTWPGACQKLLAETAKPTKFVVPISDTRFLEVKQATDPTFVVKDDVVTSQIAVVERVVCRRVGLDCVPTSGVPGLEKLDGISRRVL